MLHAQIEALPVQSVYPEAITSATEMPVANTEQFDIQPEVLGAGEQDVSDWSQEQVTAALDTFYVQVGNCTAGVSDRLGDVPPKFTRLVQMEARSDHRRTLPEERVDLLEQCMAHFDAHTPGSTVLDGELCTITDLLAQSYNRMSQNPLYSMSQRRRYFEQMRTYRARHDAETQRRSQQAVGVVVGAVAVAA